MSRVVGSSLRMLGAAAALATLLSCSEQAAMPADTGSPPVQKREIGGLLLEDVPLVAEQFGEGLRPYQNSRSAALVDWLPNGAGLLIRTRFGNTTQLHAVSKPGAQREQLTFFDEPVGAAWVRPAAANPFGFAFSKDEGGSEFYQLFFFDWQSASWQLLTDGASRNGALRWSHAGDRYVFSSTLRNGEDTDILIADLDGVSKPLLARKGYWQAYEFSLDDQQLLVSQYVSAEESYAYVMNVASGELRPLVEIAATTAPTAELPPTAANPEVVPQSTARSPTPAGTAAAAPATPASAAKVAYTDAAFSADGKGVYFVSDQDSEFARLRYLDLNTNQVRELSPDIAWDIELLAVASNGRHYAFASNEEGFSKLHLRDNRDHDIKVPNLPRGVIGGLKFNPENTLLGFSVSTANSPSDVYTLDLETGQLERWTFSEVGGLDRSRFVDAQLVRFPSFDAESIPALLFRPRGNGPFPVLVDIHGGPEGQSRPSFDAMRQYYVNELGIAVIEPNVRGSSGYGKTFLSMDNGMKREDSVKDIGALLDFIAAEPGLDANRVAVIGGSYGGYMVLASLVHYSARLRAGVEIVGISNFVSFLSNTQDYRRDRRRQEYGDERDPVMRAFLDGISPLTNTDKITRPLLVAQGANDPRVPRAESEQMVLALRQRGLQVPYLLAKDEGHGFSKKQNRDVYNAAAAAFLDMHLVRQRVDTRSATPEQAPSAQTPLDTR